MTLTISVPHIIDNKDTDEQNCFKILKKSKLKIFKLLVQRARSSLS